MKLSAASNKLNDKLSSETKTVRLSLKWFNASKGFGFLVPEDESFDVFVHVTTMQKAGLNNVGEGATFDCTLSNGNKGYQVEEIVHVIDEGQEQTIPGVQNPDGTATIGGLVKWYKPEKGFGFIIADDRQKDIFIHKSLLDKLEIETLAEGTRVRVTLKNVDKGREAQNIEIIS